MGWTCCYWSDKGQAQFMQPAAPSSRFLRQLLLTLSLSAVVLPCAAYAQNNSPSDGDAPIAVTAKTDTIDFSAANVEYDSNNDIVTAKGDVVLNRDGYSLRADNINWDRRSGEVTATGNIRSIGPKGDVAYGDSITLTDSLKDGAIENLLLVGSRMSWVHVRDNGCGSHCGVEEAK